MAASLRQGGFTGKITLLGDEPHPPYQRPPLSKKYLAGSLDEERLYLRPLTFYKEHNIDLHLTTKAKQIDRDKKQVTLANNKTLPYDILVLTTGSRVRKMKVQGAELANIFYLRGIEDVQHLRTALDKKKNRKLAIIGGGYIGLEVAAIANGLGHNVSVLEAEKRVMSRVVDPQVSSYYEKLHARHGVKILTESSVCGFLGEGALSHIELSNGEQCAADIALIGIGILPCTRLAEEAGLAIDDGIVVDELGTTSDNTIYAAGDCTDHPNALLQKRLRLESVHNAIEQAKTVAGAILGNPKPYAQIPWFWSDQYDVKLQIAGISTGYDMAVQRGSQKDNSFAIFYLKQGELIAVDAVNRGAEFMAAKALIARKAKLTAEEITDETIKPKELGN